MGDSQLFMGHVWLLCGLDFLSKLQPNSGLEHAIGDAAPSPMPITAPHASENRGAPPQSRMLARLQRHCQSSERAVIDWKLSSRHLQSLNCTPTISRRPTTSGIHSRSTNCQNFFPSCVIKHGRSRIAMAGTLARQDHALCIGPISALA